MFYRELTVDRVVTRTNVDGLARDLFASNDQNVVELQCNEISCTGV